MKSTNRRADQRLERLLNDLYRRYHRPEYLALDPLVCVRRFSDARRIEAAGLIAALLSYGRVERIIHSVNTIFARAQNDPRSVALDTSWEEKRRALAGFKHRFNSGDDIAMLLEALKIVIDIRGSLEHLFSDALRKTGSLRQAATGFSSAIRDAARQTHRSARPSFEYLLPCPKRGSACKRLNMYFRWMVRPDDGIDCGAWPSIKPAVLVMPVDTHVAQIARTIGLSHRASADWAMAEEITGRLRTFDPADPVRYDFSLCRYGMLKSRTAGNTACAR